MRKHLYDIASRIYALDVYGMQDNDTTPADIAESIKEDPAAVIEYLLDIIDDLQA